MVCSLHFGPGDFRGVSGLRRLVKDAVPSLALTEVCSPQEQGSGTAGPTVAAVVFPGGGAERPWLSVPEDVLVEVVPSAIPETAYSQFPGESAAHENEPPPVNPEAHRRTCHRQLYLSPR